MDYDKKPPADWPELTVVVETKSYAAVQTECGGGPIIGIVFTIFACAEAYFDKMMCLIRTMTDDESVMIHEKDHCRGYDHIGQSTMRDSWEQFKKEKSNGATKAD